MHDGAELLIDLPLARRGRVMLEALGDTRPAGSKITTEYRGAHRLLVLYGVGHALRFQARREHLARGGHVAMWDMGYWDREDAMRVSIDSLHPSAEQLALAPEGQRRRVALREDADPDGPILLIGLGKKSAHMYGLLPLQWEDAKLAELQSRFPDRRILWRPKGAQFVVLKRTSSGHGLPIEMVLKGCSLVVCRHSNVGVDACIAGIPVECDDGAARAIYAETSSPSREVRAEFLRRLAWWNYRPNEAREAWEWMRRVTG
jgi:hypothetical protein